MYINSMKLFNAVHVIQKYYSYSAGVLYCESVCFLKTFGHK